MAKTKKRIDQTKRVIQAAMAIAAEKGWPEVRLETIARKLKISPSNLQKDFPDTTAILLALVRETDLLVEKNFDPDEAENIHDQLFEALMLRIDSLADYREGIAALLRHLPTDPCLSQKLARNLCQSMQKILLIIRENESFLSDRIKSFGLMLVYISSLKAWAEDKTPDSSKTMAILDKRLRQAGMAARFLHL